MLTPINVSKGVSENPGQKVLRSKVQWSVMMCMETTLSSKMTLMMAIEIIILMKMMMMMMMMMVVIMMMGVLGQESCNRR
jgi:hypothetical protein